MRKKFGNEGKVVYGKTRFIERDTKPRRRYVVVKDNGKNIKVVKTNSMKKDIFGNYIEDKHKVEIDRNYHGLKERTLVDNKVFSKNRITKQKFSLDKNNGVFDTREEFILNDYDFDRVFNNATFRTGKKHKKRTSHKDLSNTCDLSLHNFLCCVIIFYVILIKMSTLYYKKSCDVAKKIDIAFFPMTGKLQFNKSISPMNVVVGTQTILSSCFRFTLDYILKVKFIY